MLSFLNALKKIFEMASVGLNTGDGALAHILSCVNKYSTDFGGKGQYCDLVSFLAKMST